MVGTETNGARLLVVEDEADIRGPICQWGKILKWDCLSVGDKTTALAMIENASDLSACVLDIRLGRFNTGGLDVLHAFRKKFPDAPVVLLTAPEQDAEKALWYGASVVVRKPIKAEELLAIVKSQIDTLQTLGTKGPDLRRLGQFEGFFNAMGVGVAVLDAEGVIRLLNTTMTGEFKFEKRWVGRLMVEVFEGKYFGDLKDDEHRLRWEEEVSFGDRAYQVSIRTSPDASGQGKLFIQTWTDITKRKRADELLGRLPALAREPLDKLGDALVQQLCELGYQRAYLYLRDSAAGENAPLVCRAAFDGQLRSDLRGTTLPSDDPYVLAAMKQKRVVRLSFEEVQEVRKLLPANNPRLLDGVSGMLKVPLYAGDKWLGIVCVERLKWSAEFDSEDMALMGLLGRGLSDAVAASARIPDQRARTHWEEPSRKINQVLSEGGEIVAVLDEVLKQGAAGTKADFAWLLLTDDRPGATGLKLQSHWSNGEIPVDEKQLQEYTHPCTDGVSARVMESGKMEIVPDLWKDKDFQKYYERIRSVQWLEVASRSIQSAVILPVLRGRTCIGVLGFYFTRRFTPTEVDLRHLETVSRLVAVALRRMGDTAALFARIAHKTKVADLMLLSSGVAHALRNQVSEVRACIEIASRQTSVEQMRFELHDALDAERRLSERLEQLLAWVKPEGMEPAEVDLGDTVNAVYQLSADRFRDHGVEFVTCFADHTPNAFGPPDAFKMAVLDLFVNAVTAFDDKKGGGEKRITAELRLCPTNVDHVELRISDTGPGIPHDQLDVFEQFDRPLETPAGGVGLGLYLAHHFITAAGGTIAFESKPGCGTTVILTLPVAPGEFL